MRRLLAAGLGPNIDLGGGDTALFRSFEPPVPSPQDARVWPSALAAAIDLWRAVADHDRISGDFRAIAAANAATLSKGADVAGLLPGGRDTRSG